MKFYSDDDYEKNFVNGFFDREEEKKEVIETNKKFEKMVLESFHERTEARFFREIDIPAMNMIEDILIKFPRYKFIKNVSINGVDYDIQIDYLNKEITRSMI